MNEETAGADPATGARELLDANRSVTLATADGEGRPWASPVYFAHDAHREFVWVSLPDALHSRNLAARPQIAMVVFDSRVAPGQGRAVYMEATAEQVAEDDAPAALQVYSRRSLADGLAGWTLEDVSDPAPHRLYRARATRSWVLGKATTDGRTHDARVPVDLTLAR